MKRILSFLMVAALFAVSCDKYDDTKLWDEIRNHADRITKLEQAQNTLNTNIAALQAIVSALQNNISVTSVVPAIQNGKEIGYTINFSSGNPVTVLHGTDGKDGATPVIGVKAGADGKYYWTINGEWLRDSDGDKVPAQGSGSEGAGKDGITPQLRINSDTNFWEVSYDNGATWTSLKVKATGEQGPQGDSIFESVSVQDDTVTFTLSDGSTITLPLGTGGAVTNLSINGTANCYIVTRAGKYSFMASRGNSGSPIGGKLIVEVQWESFGTSTAPNKGDLISDVSIDNNTKTITFTASNKKGNAVIAAYDTSSKTVWSWHIWLTDQPKDQVYLYDQGMVMDRNLGAYSTREADTGSLGLLYQYGRKDPFLGNDQGNWATKTAASTGKWSTVTSDATKGTIEYAIANPATFIKGNTQNNDWYYGGNPENDLNTRRWDDKKTIYDPCPPGYSIAHGSTDGLWCCTFQWETGFDAKMYGGDFGVDFGSSGETKYRLTDESSCYYPAAGRINTNGDLEHAMKYGYYWGYYGDSLIFGMNDDVYVFEQPAKANALSVRCMREQ